MLELVACANPKCRVRSRTLPRIAAKWQGGLCPSCRDPRDREEVLALLRRPGPSNEEG